MKMHKVRILTAILPLIFGVCVSIQAQTGGETLPTLSGTKAIEYLKQNRQYDSLMETFEGTRKGRTDETPSANALGQTAKMTAADGVADDTLGRTVAISGDTAIVGASPDDVGANTDQGSAYVFVRSGTTWNQQQKLTAADGAAGDHFGRNVAIFGETVIVGAPFDNSGANPFQGSAYIFVRSGSVWSEQQKLTAEDGATMDQFGYSVAISGETALVGAYSDSVGANGGQGSAYIFIRSGTVWSEQQKLTAEDGAASDQFGYSVAISGETAIVGTRWDNVGANTDQGSAYIFIRSGTAWSQQQKLTAADGAAEDSFGYSVAISGETAIVGAYFDDVGQNSNQGSAYIFVRSGTAWNQQQKLIAADGFPSDEFGISVTILGETAMIGAYSDDVGVNGDQGSAYIFVRSGTVWSEQQKLTAADGAQDDRFGLSVAISGESAIVGAFLDDVGANSNQGSAYVFRVLKVPFDSDGDGKTDLSIFRPALGQWWHSRSSDGGTRALTFGLSTDRITPADFTGDGKSDIALFRPSTGFWFVLRSEDNSYFATPFGVSGDVPVPTDFDADGKADIAVFRPSNSTWFINNSGGSPTTIQQFGIEGDVPVAADYDGDAKSDIAIYRPNAVGGGQWWIQRSATNVVAALQFGTSTDKTVVGDYTGDGKADIAFWRPSTGFWNILRSEDSSYYAFPFGTSGDVPSPGDYDGDGKFDAAVFRPSNSTWFANRSTAGVLIQQFGINGDLPIPNAYVR